MDTIGQMTKQELLRLIDESVDRRLKRLLGDFDLDDDAFADDEDEKEDTRSLEEILDSLDRNRWTPPAGAKSSYELLREDRDRLTL